MRLQNVNVYVWTGPHILETVLFLNEENDYFWQRIFISNYRNGPIQLSNGNQKKMVT